MLRRRRERKREPGPRVFGARQERGLAALKKRAGSERPVAALALAPLTPVILFLHEPKERIWGILLTLDAAGVSVRGLDLAAFEDWVRQEARREDTLIQPATLFYPMHRVERVELDESVGPVLGCADRFEAEVGRSALLAAGLSHKS